MAHHAARSRAGAGRAGQRPKFSFRLRGHRTGAHTDANSTHRSRAPVDPLTTGVGTLLDQPPGRAANCLASALARGPRLLSASKRVLNKAHLHLGDLLPSPSRRQLSRRPPAPRLRAAACGVRRRLGARARHITHGSTRVCSTLRIDGAVARAPLSPVAQGAG